MDEETKEHACIYFEYQANKPRFTKKKHPPFEAYELALVDEGKGIVKERLDVQGAYLLDCVTEVFILLFLLLFILLFILLFGFG